MEQSHTINDYTLRFRAVPAWQLGLVTAGAFAVVAAFAVLASGLFLILLPVGLVGALAYRLLGPRRVTVPRRGPHIIEGEYVVVSDGPAGDGTDRSRP